MSQSVMSSALEAGEQTQADAILQRGAGGFDFRPVPPIAPVAMLIGVVSASAWISVYFTPVALMGIAISWRAVSRIRKSTGELGGLRLAWSGLAVSAVFFTAGIAKDRYLYYTEVPEGHVRLSFPDDISKNGFIFENGRRQLHPDVAQYNGERIFTKGFMWNTGTMNGISNFLLLKDNGECCFGGNPKATDMILVKMLDGLVVDSKPGLLVSVAGTLECHPEAQMNPDGTGAPVYILKATHFEVARTPH